MMQRKLWPIFTSSIQVELNSTKLGSAIQIIFLLSALFRATISEKIIDIRSFLLLHLMWILVYFYLFFLFTHFQSLICTGASSNHLSQTFVNLFSTSVTSTFLLTTSFLVASFIILSCICLNILILAILILCIHNFLDAYCKV